MLNQPEITAKVNGLNATFLEPAAGEGVFLVELLKCRIKVAAKQSKTTAQFNENVLVGLSTLYGIEYMADNVKMLVMNMILTFDEGHLKVIDQKFHAKPNKKIKQSAEVIINANMVQGDTLKQINLSGEPIIFSEWKMLPGHVDKVQRVEYTFESIINGGDSNDTVTGYQKNKSEQLDLFALDADNEEQEDEQPTHYVPVKWTDIYKQLVE
ncbi:DNA methyltransferase [Lactobacillus sp. ESL0680]|uniref:DNA methyltransferase n=1 Tax=Lactobacillus sp. ESL0680 TaxID=2983210 RepID=UPI0023F6A413|nr:DNA methyltransferase [Lactobacillus sp. ESL0680]WEV39066.1 DNA methyltransferase [Lactobacillus sp. ESL0680]